MARKTNAVNADVEPVEEVDMEMLTTAPDDWEFETVSDEIPTRINFTDVGDSVVLQYNKEIYVEQEPDKDGKDQSFWLYLWVGRDGRPYSINKSWKLEQAMKDGAISKDDWCRLTFVKELETSRGLNAMKDIKVEKRIVK